MLRDRLGKAETKTRRLPFLESSMRVLPAHSQRFGDGRTGAPKRTSDRDSRRGGCQASSSMALKETPQRPPNRHRLSWQRFTDKLAHRVEIQASQPRLHSGPRHKGSPPPIRLAPNRQALIRTWETGPTAHNSAIGRSTQERGVTHQVLGSAIGTPQRAPRLKSTDFNREKPPTVPVAGQARRKL